MGYVQELMWPERVHASGRLVLTGIKISVVKKLRLSLEYYFFKIKI